MSKLKFTIVLSLIFAFLGACSYSPPPRYITKEEYAPRVYEELPLNIVVLPSVNLTTAADAKELFSATIHQALAEKGYYVLPIETMNSILKEEAAWDTENLPEDSYRTFADYFGADALLYTEIFRWDTDYYLTSGNVSVGITFKLVSTKDGEVIWENSLEKIVDTSSNSDDYEDEDDDSSIGAIFAAFLVDAIVTGISTAAQDYEPIARDVNNSALSILPYGFYHPRFNVDQNDAVMEAK